MSVTTTTTVATSSLSTVGYCEEFNHGTVNPSPSLKTFRHSSFGLKLTKDTVESDEKNATRMSSGSRHTIRRASGPISADLSHTSHSDALEAIMGGSWVDGVSLVAPGDITSLSVTAATKIWTLGSGNPITLGLRVGDKVQIANMATTGNNGTFTIASLSATTFTTIEAPAGDEADDDDATITVLGKKLIIGRSYRAFTFERALTDVGKFLVFTGAYMNKLSLSASPNDIMKVDFDVLAMNADALASASVDGTGAVETTETDLGTLTVAANVITCGTSNWTSEGFAVGDSIYFSSMTGIDDFPGKMLTVAAIDTTAMTVAEAIPAGTATAYTLNKVGLPDYTDAPTTSSMTALEGGLYMGDDMDLIATVTDLSLEIDNQMGGEAVVGKNYVPTIVWGKKQNVSGSMTILFMDGTAYNRFDQEAAAPMIFQGSDPDGNWYTFRFPRLKYNSSEIGDGADTGLPLSVEFMAEPPTAAQIAAGWDNSHIVIQESPAS